MRFNDFRFRIAFRVVLLGATLALLVYMFSRPNMIFAAGLTFIIILGQLAELYRFTSQTNRKLTRFLESVKYSDFISGFTSDNKLGKSFRELNSGLTRTTLPWNLKSLSLATSYYAARKPRRECKWSGLGDGSASALAFSAS